MDFTVNHYLGMTMIVIVILLGIVLLLPSEKKRKRRKRKPDINQEPVAKDWEKIAKRFENQLIAADQELAKMKKQEVLQAKQTAVEKVKVKKLEEKLSQEREWLKKEGDNAQKKILDYQNLKDELKSIQDSYTHEHSANIRMEKKIDALNQEISILTDTRRSLESEILQLKARNDSYRADIAHLKKNVNELKKQEEDNQWVSKTDYNEIKARLSEKEKEFERLKRNEKEAG